MAKIPKIGLSFICALVLATLSFAIQPVSAESYTHDLLCRGLKPSRDSKAQTCLNSYVRQQLPQKQILKIHVSSETEAFDALRKLLEAYGGRDEALEELNYADFVGVAQTTGMEQRLSYFLLDTGAYVTPQLILDVNEKDLGLFFKTLKKNLICSF